MKPSPCSRRSALADAREALIARRLVAIDALAMETFALARASTGLLRDAYAAAGGCALAGGDVAGRRALSGGSAGPEQRIVVQHIRRGGQVVGMVNKQGDSPP